MGIKTLTLAATLALAAFSVSACRDGPGHDSDRHGRHGQHDRDGNR